MQSNAEQRNNQPSNRTNVVSYLPRHFTSQTDRVALSRAAGSLEEALDGAASLKDERFTSVSTRQMPLDVWNVLKAICWEYSRGNANVKRAATHSVVIEKGSVTLRALSEYQELGSAEGLSKKSNYLKLREFSSSKLDYRYSVRDFRNYKVPSPISLKCQLGIKELMEDLAERYHTSISIIAAMSVVAAYTKATEEETVPMNLIELCNRELETFKAEVGQLAAPITD